MESREAERGSEKDFQNRRWMEIHLPVGAAPACKKAQMQSRAMKRKMKREEDERLLCRWPVQERWRMLTRLRNVAGDL